MNKAAHSHSLPARSFRNAALVSLLILCLTACDLGYGVDRRADKFEHLPASCIENTLRHMEGLSDIRVTVTERGESLFGLRPPTTYHRYCYKYKGIDTCLGVSQDYSGLYEYSHGYMLLNEAPPQEKVDIILPMIRLIDKTIGTTCNIPNLSNIKERCDSKIRC